MRNSAEGVSDIWGVLTLLGSQFWSNPYWIWIDLNCWVRRVREKQVLFLIEEKVLTVEMLLASTRLLWWLQFSSSRLSPRRIGADCLITASVGQNRRWGRLLMRSLRVNKSIGWPLSENPGEGLPWWRSGWESACQCRGHRFEPWSGRIPHAVEQLGPWATTTEPARREAVLRNKRGRDSERPAHREEGWPPLATTRGSPRKETKTQHSHK